MRVLLFATIFITISALFWAYPPATSPGPRTRRVLIRIACVSGVAVVVEAIVALAR